MHGRRILDLEGNAGVDAVMDGEPGVYWLHEDGRDFWAKLPHGRICHLPVDPDQTFQDTQGPVWRVIEEPDGSLTIQPSIWMNQGRGGSRGEWHGFLERGVWRQVS
jgi:hypothetical protein